MVAKTIVPHKRMYQVWNINCHSFCTDVHKATIVYLSLLLIFLEKSFVIEKKSFIKMCNILPNTTVSSMQPSFVLLKTIQKNLKTNFVVFKSKAIVKHLWDYIWTTAFVDTDFFIYNLWVWVMQLIAVSNVFLWIFIVFLRILNRNRWNRFRKKNIFEVQAGVNYEKS